MNDEICVKSQWIRGLTFPFSILLNSCHTGIPHRHLLPYSFSHRPRWRLLPLYVEITDYKPEEVYFPHKILSPDI